VLRCHELLPLTTAADVEEPLVVVPEAVNLDLRGQLARTLTHGVEASGGDQSGNRGFVQFDPEAAGEPTELALEVGLHVGVVEQFDVGRVACFPVCREMMQRALQARKRRLDWAVAVDPAPK